LETYAFCRQSLTVLYSTPVDMTVLHRCFTVFIGFIRRGEYHTSSPYICTANASMDLRRPMADTAAIRTAGKKGDDKGRQSSHDFWGRQNCSAPRALKTHAIRHIISPHNTSPRAEAPEKYPHDKTSRGLTTHRTKAPSRTQILKLG